MPARAVTGAACFALALVLAGTGPAGDVRRKPTSSLTLEQARA